MSSPVPIEPTSPRDAHLESTYRLGSFSFTAQEGDFSGSTFRFRFGKLEGETFTTALELTSGDNPSYIAWDPNTGELVVKLDKAHLATIYAVSEKEAAFQAHLLEGSPSTDEELMAHGRFLIKPGAPAIP